MRFNRKKLTLIILFGICITQACKKEKPTVKEVSQAIPPPIEITEKADLPIQLTSGKSKTVFSYTAALALSKIDYSHGDSVVLKYTSNGKPGDFFRYKSGKLIFNSQFSVDKNGLVVEADQYTILNGNYYFLGYYTLTYATNGQLTSISYYNPDNQLLNGQQKIYTVSGNLANDNSIVPDLMLSYQYDDKNGLFKNAAYTWLFVLEKENLLFLSVLNNIQQCNYPLMPDSNQNFSYVYNADKYPETINSTLKGISSSFTVTYKQLN